MTLHPIRATNDWQKTFPEIPALQRGDCPTYLSNRLLQSLSLPRQRKTRYRCLVVTLSVCSHIITRRLSDVFVKPISPKSVVATTVQNAISTFDSNLSVYSRVIMRRLRKALYNALFPKPHREARRAPALTPAARGQRGGHRSARLFARG